MDDIPVNNNIAIFCCCIRFIMLCAVRITNDILLDMIFYFRQFYLDLVSKYANN